MIDYEVVLDDSEYKEYKYYVESLRKAKEALEKGFSSKAQQKDALSFLSSAWFEYHQVFSYCAYKLIKNKTRDEIFKMLWNMPDNAYHYKPSKMKEFAEIDEIKDAIQPMEEMKELYTTIKSAPITPKVKETEYDKKLKKYNLALSKKDKTKITNQEKYNEGIDKIVQMADDFITPFYDNAIDYLIMIQKQKIKNNQEPSATPEEIRKLYNDAKKMELLDIRFKAMNAIDEDINSVELSKYNNIYRSWVINEDKLFTIKVISAGGWNIQRLHYRVLTHFKKL